jgi:DNA-binding IclR family transcriptional regulator
MDPAGRARKSIQSVEIGLRVVMFFVEGDLSEAYLREVAQGSGLSRSQTHRYLQALVNAGMVKQNPLTGKYSLGTLAVRIGLAAMATMDPLQIAADHLELLLADLRTTGALSVWGDYGPTIIRWIDGGSPIATSLRVGSVLPLQTSAAGLLHLAFCSLEQTGKHLDAERAYGVYVDDADLEVDIERVRRNGYSTARGTVVPGLSAVCAPVFDSGNALVGALSILARAEDEAFFTAEKIAKIKEQAYKASVAIGWSGTDRRKKRVNAPSQTQRGGEPITRKN